MLGNHSIDAHSSLLESRVMLSYQYYSFRNEHLQQGDAIIPHITTLMNACLEQGRVPKDWRNCLLTIIPKGSGDPLDPSAWRGIAKRNTLSKLLSSLITDRLTTYLDYKGTIPPEQHGFTRGRSTITACKILLENIAKSVRTSDRPLYAVFVDYRAAFDMAPRAIIVGKLAAAGVSGKMLALIRETLQEGMVTIEDGVSELPPVLQTNGVVQGDNASPLLFSVLLSDLPETIRREHDIVYTLTYADDTCIYSRSRKHLQKPS